MATSLVVFASDYIVFFFDITIILVLFNMQFVMLYRKGPSLIFNCKLRFYNTFQK